MGGLSDFCKEAKALSLTKLQSDARVVGTTGQAYSATAQPLDELGQGQVCLRKEPF